VTLEGRERLVAATPGSLDLEDISSSGSTLLTHTSNRRFMMGLAPSDRTEKSFSWLDYTEPIELAADGGALLFEEWGEGGGPAGGIYLRRFDGSAPVRLGDGLGLSLSPDGKSVLARLYTSPPKLAVIPTGAGQAQTLPSDGLHYEECGRFFPDGKRVVFAAREGQKAARLYVQDVNGGKPVPLTAEGSASPNPQCVSISPDGEQLAAVDASRRIVLVSARGGEVRPIPGATAGEKPLRWSPDGRHLYVGRGASVFRVEPLSGNRELWREFAPPEPAGVRPDSWFIVLSADARSYFYSFQTHLSELYLVNGLR
jgi:hypothetical protein